MKKKIYLDTAQKIGDRLVSSAIHKNTTCTWIINTPDRKNKALKKSIKEPAGVGVYQGVAGVVLFLIELYKLTKKNEYKLTAESALRYLVLKTHDLPNNSFGFHSGRVGVAFTFYKASQAFNRDLFINTGLEIIKPLVGNEENDNGLDIISGAAGAIPALLKMSEISNNGMELQMAVVLGENILKRARYEPTGWSWDGGNAHVRNLCGYAHGASGMGHAFLELYNFTADEKYLYAAEQAFLYERQFFNKDKLNWPDFRYTELSEYLYQDRIEELKEVIKSGNLPPYENKYMFAWCHGAPGIALSRIRAYEITGHEAYKSEALLAVEGTKRSLAQGTNYSLCHGIGGNCESLIYAASALNDQKAFSMAEEFASKGIMEYEERNRAWPCGTMGRTSDPSLMLGEAGIGYYLLRLYSDKIKSVIIVTSNTKMISREIDENKLLEVRNKYVEFYFDKTKRFVTKVSYTPERNQLKNFKDKIGDTQSDVTDYYEYLKTIKISKPEYFNDLFGIEKIIYLRTIGFDNFSDELVQAIKSEKRDSINWHWKGLKIKLSSSVMLVERNFNWDEYFSEVRNNSLNIFPKSEFTPLLIYRQDNNVIIKKLTLFAYIILVSIKEYTQLCSILENVEEAFEENKPSQKVLETQVVEQLNYFYKAGFIEFESKFKNNLDEIILLIQNDLYSPSDLLSSSLLNKSTLTSLVKNSIKSLSNDETLYRKYQLEFFFVELLSTLERLHISHYFEKQINKVYKVQKFNNGNIYNEILEELEQIYPKTGESIYYKNI